MNIAKPLMLLGATSLLTGCFLTLDVGEGGYVESTFGDCEEFSSCSYEVTDTSFDESFTAIAKGGYVFSHWRGGDGYQCPGSENPVCQVSNTQGAGNANAESFVASDADFGIVEPVFRVLRAPSPVVLDATGKVIGVPVHKGIDWSGEQYVAVLVSFEGVSGAHAVVLDNLEERLLTYSRWSNIYSENPTTCGGQIALDIDAYVGKPIVPLAATACGMHAADLSADPIQYSPYAQWDGVAEVWQRTYGGGTDTGLPMVAVELDVTFPVRVELR